MTDNYLNILAETIRNNWDAPALTDFYLTEDGSTQDTSRGNHYTYGEMYAELCHVAELLTSLGLQKGDHIAICGANSAHWVIAYLAIAKMQGASVTVMHTLQPDEIAHLVNFSDAKTLFTDEDLWSELKSQSVPLVGSVISLEDWVVLGGKKGEFNKSSLSLREELEVGFPQSAPDSLAMICFTSGTSGKAKGVMLSYRNLTVNINFLFDELLSYTNKKTLSFLPLGHIYGLYNEILRPLCIGTHINVIHTTHNIIKYYQIIKPIYAVVVPSILENIVNWHTDNNLSLREFIINQLGGNIDEISIGGAGLNNNTERKLIEDNVPIAIGYGMTECGPLISVATKRNSSLKAQSVGFILKTLNIKFSPAGEILVKGENVMLGYYKDPEATAAKIDSDGWLHTGDKGHLDEDGYLYVEGRLEQDIIVLPNGENIRPDHIESLINALPEVSESIVLARDGKLVAIAVPSSLPFREESEVGSLRRKIMREINPQLPLFSQLYDVEITDQPLARTEKQTIKRYLYS
ncbi:MAG: AMP-binding protein [Paludibacteraceae bacterium]|nr:AMP-binding protein [Paludibacteraceae bacterium]